MEIFPKCDSPPSPPEQKWHPFASQSPCIVISNGRGVSLPTCASETDHFETVSEIGLLPAILTACYRRHHSKLRPTLGYLGYSNVEPMILLMKTMGTFLPTDLVQSIPDIKKINKNSASNFNDGILAPGQCCVNNTTMSSFRFSVAQLLSLENGSTPLIVLSSLQNDAQGDNVKSRGRNMLQYIYLTRPPCPINA